MVWHVPVEEANAESLRELENSARFRGSPRIVVDTKGFAMMMALVENLSLQLLIVKTRVPPTTTTDTSKLYITGNVPAIDVCLPHI